MKIHPKGKLIFLSFKEIEPQEKEGDFSFIPGNVQLLTCLSDKKDVRIELITSDSLSYTRLHKFYKRALSDVGYTNFNGIHFNSNGCIDSETRKKLDVAEVVLFVGDQSGLFNILKESKILGLLHKKYIEQENFVVAGVNIGSVCLPSMMIVEETRNDPFRKGLELIPSLGFIDNCIIDTQYMQETGYDKLAYTIVEHRDFMGLGLGNDTALIIEKGSVASCRGDGTVMVINPCDIDHLEKNCDTENHSFYMKNLKGRIMIDGCIVHLDD
ncbi:Type 1 glutamine amidotransferase-like domain-containing protein [Chryseobacterium gambrini]|uniref:Type 1 glutamine amidotransferase-like domain-containing protein n=1 Tax=Chryseobacterium gambrini TaxID=373672 RepID=UPI0022F3CD14|nr:Type 1 glutamine amidotransferase-like domain-containing protein [Chryseobacterium gambrini]WBX97842.1 Type 1 glutamine amidotransferase-like domain-containing protein [Chryseobacterium gambrini]